jgi:mono/diheme cytochrome c family protein
MESITFIHPSAVMAPPYDPQMRKTDASKTCSSLLPSRIAHLSRQKARGLKSGKMLSRTQPHFQRLRKPLFAALFWAIALAAMAGVMGCKPLPPSKSAAEFTPEEAHGAQVFQAYCAECHYPTSTQGKRGPGLQALTKLKSMPSGAPPSDERISKTILHGHGLMQPVPVPDADMQSLLAYLHTL